MKADKAAKQALINILNGIYSEIHTIESNLGIRASENDYRPRIEYFHDAVRVLTSGVSLDKRLSVEFLAYDISMLRHIQANPVPRKNDKMNLSPGTAVVKSGYADDYAATPAQARGRLSELYKNYAVLFAALFAEQADRDYQSKVNEGNYEVETIAELEHAAKQAAKKQGAEVDLATFVEQNMGDPDLMKKMLAALGNKKKKMLASDLVKHTAHMIKEADNKIKEADKAHFTYVTSQLAVYENAKDVVKKMAVSGMNIVGQFVENAMSDIARGGGRGR
ncbi:MAG TPA: hypothetical protein VFT64_02140 [Rickettsiales bacterium]|nr:hypothetical protein [Rickettsiales bacterium]